MQEQPFWWNDYFWTRLEMNGYKFRIIHYESLIRDCYPRISQYFELCLRDAKQKLEQCKQKLKALIPKDWSI